MNYENLPCPVCGKHLHEGDDIVVCPDCATPQHRACWLENGRCVNFDKHGTDFVWSPPETSEKPEEKSNILICASCGSENSADSVTCGNCGALLDKNYIPPAVENSHCPFCGMSVEKGLTVCPHCGAPLMSVPHDVNNKYVADVGLDENEKIGEYTVGELSLYVRSSSKRYIPLFKKIEGGKKFTFNWAAFFFGPLWYFFRRIYSYGIVFILLAASASLFFATASDKMTTIFEPYSEAIQNQTITVEQQNALMEKMLSETKFPVSVGFGLTVVINLVSALIADKIYYRRVIKDVTSIKAEISGDDLQKLLISKRGGTSGISAVCGFFTYQITGNLLLYIADYAASHF